MDEKQTLQLITNNLNSKKVFSEVVTVTPKIAEFLLNLNWPLNRPISETNLQKYTNAVRHGHWELNGESIIIANTGVMIDGQHRLWAVTYAEKPLTTVMTFGVEYSTKVTSTINCGRPRSLAFLSNMGTAKAAALNFIVRLMYGSSESTAANLMTMDQVYGAAVEATIKKHSGKSMPILRQAPINAAAALWTVHGEGEYVTDVHHHLMDLDSGALPPIGKAFLHQCAEASMGAKHKPIGNELFVRAFKVFDPDQALVKKLVVKDTANTIEEARKMVTKAMKTSGVTLDATPIATKKSGKKTSNIKEQINLFKK